MRDPARKAFYLLLAVLAGSSLIWVGAERHERIGEDWSSTGRSSSGR